MTGPTSRTRDEELLLARISAAAGRARLGRRLATHTATAYRPLTRIGRHLAIRRLSAGARYGPSATTSPSPSARLDLYAQGMTVVVKGRVHVVRYDTTSVFQHSTGRRGSSFSGATVIHTLSDVAGKRLVLYGGPGGGGDPQGWERVAERAITCALLPGALAALHRGERVWFGDVWLTTEHIGHKDAGTAWPWSQVQRVRPAGGFLTATVDGHRHRLGPPLSRIPNVFVLRALVEHCRGGDAP
ncbi:hypothetical protein ACFW17_09990 [Streptomyces sp. NPDC058961]|uniref:hypothetical protein n=1 Tax=Streptomyces sp. NPDC058961 TaxID=3346680 RepID=UPI00367B0040